jgi:hypothetical protein
VRVCDGVCVLVFSHKQNSAKMPICSRKLRISPKTNYKTNKAIY